MTTPRATYRLQLGPHLDLPGARALVPYLRDLGVSHLYLSPVWEARPGSTHGYDVTDPTRVSEALGGEAALRDLAGAGLDLLLDVVPNHMAVDEGNPYWRDPEVRARVFDLDPTTGRHRRFFDVDDLAGVRVEDPEVFALTQRLALRLVREGVAAGLRVDHPDGLADPAGYLRRLATAGAGAVWVEKILEPGERLRDWPVEGTTGYDFLNEVGRLYVDPAGEAPLGALHRELTGETRPFGEVAREAKSEQARTTFAPEVERLARALDAEGLAVAVAALTVYRTYVEPGAGRVDEADRRVVERAVRRGGLPERVARVLLLEEPGHEDFVTRFQQTTGPVMAKGVEDTAFYRHTRLVALNEVGGDPDWFSLDVEGFHRLAAARAERFPRALLATQTHDTKRSHDVRARLGALAGMPDAWAARVRAWLAAAPPGPRGAPDASERYLILQTVVGAWPLSLERLLAYVEKALREEKVHTSWIDPDRAWEEGAADWCRALHADRGLMGDLGAFARRLAAAGERAALGQVAIKLTAPGVPDLYQGDELVDLSLVDPDNRRPVDWALRRGLLGEVAAGAPVRPETAKLALVARVLDLRRRRPEPFAAGYLPLEAGPDACAYARGDEVMVVAPLRPPGEGAVVAVPASLRGRWREVVGGRELDAGGALSVAAACAGGAVAVLARVSRPGPPRGPAGRPAAR